MDKNPVGVIDVLPGLVWTTGPDGRTDFVNRRMRVFAGLDAGPDGADAWERVLHPEDRATFHGWFAAVRAGVAEAPCEARLRRRDATYRWFQFEAEVIRDGAGAVVGWCGVASDIDGLKRTIQRSEFRDARDPVALDSIPYSLAIMTPTGAVDSINRHLSDFTGVGLDEVKDWEKSQIVHPEDFPAVQAAWRRAVETRTPHDVELRIRRADGVYRWFQNRGLPLFDDQGEVLAWYSMQIDIDDRRQAENRLASETRLLEMAASGQPLDAILNAVCQIVEREVAGCHCGVLLLDPKGRTIERGAAPSLPAAFIDAEIGRSIDADDGSSAMAMRLNALVVVSDIASDDRFAAAAWSAAAVAHGIKACWSTPIISGDGNVLGAFGISYDRLGPPPKFHQELVGQFHHIASLAIERAMNDASLRQSEAFLTEGQRLSQTGSFLWRPDTDEITFSAELYRIFGFTPDEPVTLERIGERVHPDDRELLAERIEAARRLDDPFDYQIRLQMPDGSVKHLQTIAHNGVGPDRRPQILGALQDVTQRRASEETLDRVRSELARVTRATSLGALTASIAHEVNQPLAGIVTNAGACLKMLAADPPNVLGAQQTARRTVRDANRAADIVSRLRALFAKQDARKDLVDLNTAAREVVTLVSHDLQRSRVTARLDLAERLPRVTGDRVQLQQVILNLVLNALDAMRDVDGRAREMWITTAQDPSGQVRLAVQDCGVGLDPEGLERLFDAFYTTKADGMGIGLSVSHSIVENHGGRLWSENNTGPGATFLFTLPRVRPAAMPTREVSRPSRSSTDAAVEPLKETG